MKKTVILCLVTFILLSEYANSEEKSGAKLSIVKEHKSNAVIVIPENPPPIVTFAAKELKEYIKKITGAELPVKTIPSKGKITIYVGRDENGEMKQEMEKLPSDSYKIFCGENHLVLFGKDYSGPPLSAPSHPFKLEQTYNKELNLSKYGEAGTLFAVYDFLRQLGVRWYMPGELGEVVPELADIEFKEQNKTVSPDYSYRFLYFNDADNDPKGMLWFRRLGLGAPKPIFFNHTMQHLQRELKKTHPEYFAIVDGERDLNNTCMGEGSLKLTNPEVVKRVADFARKNLDKDKQLYIFPICLPDGYKRPDDADTDKIEWKKGDSGKLSEYVWDFMNKVAKDVYSTHPDRKIGNIAYSSWKLPPEKINKLSPNMFVMICRSGTNMGRSSYFDENKHKLMSDCFDKWTEKSNELYAWDYYLLWNNASDLNGAPIFFTKIINDDLKHLKGKIKGEFIECSKAYVGKCRSLASPGMQHLNLYITASLYWDANQDLNTLINDYCLKFYGPAAKDMRTFFDEAEKIWMRPQKREPYTELYTSEDLKQLENILEKASKIAEKAKENKYVLRIKLIKDELNFFMDTCNLKLNKLPEMSSKKVEEPVNIDGLDSEKFWKTAQVSSLKKMQTGRTPEIKTEIKVVNDNEKLYIFAECFEPNMKDLNAPEKDRDSYIWKDETLEFFIMPEDRKEYFQIAITPSSSIWDGNWKLMPEKKMEGFKAAKWNCNLEIKVKKLSDRWTIEMAIPFKEISFTGEKPNTLFINIMRSRTSKGMQNYFAWSPSFKSSIHDSTRFGKIILNQ